MPNIRSHKGSLQIFGILFWNCVIVQCLNQIDRRVFTVHMMTCGIFQNHLLRIPDTKHSCTDEFCRRLLQMFQTHQRIGEQQGFGVRNAVASCTTVGRTPHSAQVTTCRKPANDIVLCANTELSFPFPNIVPCRCEVVQRFRHQSFQKADLVGSSVIQAKTIHSQLVKLGRNRQ